MKKAKIMLTAICVLAVVGGALAFKAKSRANVYCLIPETGICYQVAFTTLKPFLPGISTINPCPDQTVFYSGNNCATTYIETLNTVWQTDL